LLVLPRLNKKEGPAQQKEGPAYYLPALLSAKNNFLLLSCFNGIREKE
jgi:hypothetical protein